MASFYYYDQNRSFSFFLWYSNLVIPVRFQWQKPKFAQERKPLKDFGRSSKMTSSCKWPIIQNAAERLTMNIGKYSHITQALQDLHWLPVRARIHFKILILVFKAIHDGALSIPQKSRFESSEIPRAQWNGTFRLHRPDPSPYAFGYCSCKPGYKRAVMRTTISSIGEGHFGPTDRNDQTDQSGPFSKLVLN